MSHRAWKDYKVDDIVGKNRKQAEGVVDPTKACDSGYMDEGEIRPLTTEMATKKFRRDDD